MMLTGLHTVIDIFCVGCGSIMGWKYVSSSVTYSKFMVYVSLLVAVSYMDGFFQETAHEKNQKYKEGKSVLER